MRSWGAMILATSLLSGCGPRSELSPDAHVTVTGALATQAGAPVAGVQVQLIRQPDALQAIGDLFAIIGSVGLACITGQLDICSPFATTTSDAHGKFAFGMKGSDTQGATDDALTFTAFARCPAQPAPATSPCATSTDFIVQKTSLALPALEEWTALGSESDDGAGHAQFSWPTLSATVGGGAASDAQVIVRDVNGNQVWLADAKTASTLSLDRHVTQDFPGSWLVMAERSDSSAGTRFAKRWYSSAQAYAAGAYNPLSRTSDCIIQGPNGPIDLPRPCPLTDGNMGTRLTPDAQLGSYNWVAIDFGFAHPLALLVLYDVHISGSSQQLTVETSSDLMTWTTAATVKATPYQALPLTATAQYVRLRVVDSDGAFLAGGNSEVAIYAPDGT